MLKKILFDFITLQDDVINGGMFYTQKIFYEIVNKDVEIYGLYDGNIPISERIRTILNMHKIALIDIRDRNVYETINNMQIDTFFIGIAQRYNSFDLCDLKCKIVIVCHDLFDMSLEYFKILQSDPLKTFTKKYLIRKRQKRNKIKLILMFLLYPLVLLRRYIRQKKEQKRTMHNYENLKKLIIQDNVFVVTDSEYSKYSIEYFLGTPKNKIKVFYAPFSNGKFEENAVTFNESLLKDKKYFLLISMDRSTKNAILFIEQWEKVCLYTNYEYDCVLIGKIKVNMKNCIILEEVDSSELAYLYKNAFALVYPSFAEGFGYPPIEAAAYGTPSICSNVTSIPEICGDMPVYFSPFYQEDLFRAMIKMMENRDIYVEKAKQRFLEVIHRQKEDLEKLFDLILGERI
ncbi:MAG: glycosyltransferase [Fibromonadales bacterium]|nr:glycosyltransferase [Fibromonadales bacterium]